MFWRLDVTAVGAKILLHLSHKDPKNMPPFWYAKLGDISPTLAAWVNSLWPSDTIWRQRSGSTLAQVMACCLTAQGHYLNQYWLIVSNFHWHSYEGNLTQDTLAINQLYYLENYLSKFSFKSPRGQWVKCGYGTCYILTFISSITDIMQFCNNYAWNFVGFFAIRISFIYISAVHLQQSFTTEVFGTTPQNWI